MALDEEQRKHLLKALGDKWTPPRPCAVCGHTDWELGDKVFEVSEFNPKAVVLGGPRLPVVAATCKQCGYTLFFNAIVLGVVDPASKEATG